MLFVVGLAILCGKWITWWAAIAMALVYGPIKECAIDPRTEPAGWHDGAASGVCDFDDWGFYIAGSVLGVVVVYFSQLPGSMWPWPARCRPCCPPSRDEELSYSLCCGHVRLEYDWDTDDNVKLQGKLQDERERVELLHQRHKEIEMMGLRHD